MNIRNGYCQYVKVQSAILACSQNKTCVLRVTSTRIFIQKTKMIIQDTSREKTIQGPRVLKEQHNHEAVNNYKYYIRGTDEYTKYLITKMATQVPLAGRNLTMDRLYTSIPIQISQPLLLEQTHAQFQRQETFLCIMINKF